MTNTAEDFSIIPRLAKRLEEEIHRRHLLPGDRFLTAVEAGHILGVSRATADRAMGVLARDEVLLRRRSLGSFVGPGAKFGRKNQVQTVVVLMSGRSRSGNLSPRPGLLMDGIREQIADVNVQFCFIPSQDALLYVKDLLRQLQDAGILVGVLAVSCPREIYEHLAETGIPTVVFGSLFPGNAKLPSIDSDNRQAGRLLMQYLLDRGHSRTALLATSDGRPGDHDFLDGISEVLSEAGLPHNALKIRVVLPETATAVPVIKELLSSTDRPTGLIVRSHRFVELIELVAAEMGLAIPEQVEIACQTPWPSDSSEKPFSHAHVQTEINATEVAGRIGQMLARQSGDEPAEPDRIIIPVGLCMPNAVGG